MGVNVIDPSGDFVSVGDPLEVGPGRGNMRVTSMPASQWFAGNGLRGALELIGGRTVSHARLAAEQPMIGAAIWRLLTWSIRVPLKVYRRVDDADRKQLGPKDHPLARSILDPWEGGSRADLVQALLGPVLVHGNGLNEIEEGARGVIRFDDLDWRTAAPIMASARRIAGWTVREDGDEREVSADKAIHVKWWSPLGPVGISPLRQLGTTVRIEDAAQRYQAAIFRNGARPPSAIQPSVEFLGLEGPKRDALMDQLADDVESIYGNPDNGGRPALLPPGVEWNAIGHTAVEAELIKQREVAVQESLAVYHLFPANLGLVDKSNADSFAAQQQAGYTDGLAPPLILIESALNAQLVRHLLREDDIYVEFDFAGILRGDRLKEIEALREAIGTALMTPNEGRRVLNLPESQDDGMGDFYLPRNNLWPVKRPHPDDPAFKPSTEEDPPA